ncbi:alanyl-tRNA editing protein [Sinanaerobacter chloroacetimidivorans]|uniref:Alanyl-transfer RNA synthetases family profile domain-containing protein n=1 Tax=Sinanaerobacter chloroacetimidivorans TaxID=2818044 RepID=A0A8J7W479_9FIRM|nr:hypothetical protein [Sinanaerobacter chloroacetimidivorans]MBR0600642.1 hypothetical protein [Sinanaerobacter chloroacetimidivorans]
MNTKKLYQQNVYKKEGTASVVDIIGGNDPSGPVRLVLDETIFFPVGGGQPCDIGRIDGYSVRDVYEEDGIIYHVLDQKQQDSEGAIPPAEAFTLGQQVQISIDWERRFNHMQRHCGEHILSGIFFRECGGVNRGFHMGEDYMTIDIDVKDISWEKAMEIERLTNEIIWQNVPVTTRYFHSREEAEHLPLRKALALDEDISIVCVGSEENPADCVACCGTHPSTSGQVGLLKILKLESYKGMTRVYFKAGKEAYLDFQNKHDMITKLNQRYSADTADLLDKIQVQEEKSKGIRQELYQLKNAFINQEVNNILSEYEGESNKTPSVLSVIIKEYPHFNANDILAMTRILTERVNHLLVLVSISENTVILACSGNPDCGKIVKENANVWRGKGGGNAGSARALFPSKEDLDCFVTFVRQAYQAR